MLELLWVFVTLLGDPLIWSFALLFIIAAYLIEKMIKINNRKVIEYKPGLKRFLILVVPSLLFSLLLVESLKMILQIPRPCLPCPGELCNPFCPATFSFPSGHTATITAIVTSIFLLLRKRQYFVLFILPVLVGISRIVLRVHYPIDIVGGFAFGVAITFSVGEIIKKSTE